MLKMIGRLNVGYDYFMEDFISLITFSYDSKRERYTPNVVLNKDNVPDATDKDAWEKIFINLCYRQIDANNNLYRGSNRDRVENVVQNAKFGYFGEHADFHEITDFPTFDVDYIYAKVMEIIKKEKAEWDRFYGNLSLWADEHDCFLCYNDKGELKMRDYDTGRIVAKKYWPTYWGFDSLTLNAEEIKEEIYL